MNKTHQELKDYWVDHFRKQKESGVCIEEYCRRQGIPPTSFHSARKRYLEQPLTPNKTTAIVPIVMEPQSRRIQVSVNGIQLAFDSGTSAEDLQSVISCLAKL